jgi:SAM-dependent methyltransferase
VAGSPRPRRRRAPKKPCVICGNTSATRLFASDGFAFFECLTCDVVFVDGAREFNRPEELFSREYFTDGGAGYPGYLDDEAVHRRQAGFYFRRLERYGIVPGSGRRLLDVGCAAGFVVDEANQRGWHASGCDVSEYMVSFARTTLSLDVARADFLSTTFEPGSFDVITMFGVLEHLPLARESAQRAYDLLRPGGALVIETWDRRSLLSRALGSRWHVYAPPTTLYYHSRRSLRHLFAGERWDVVAYGPSVKWITLRHAGGALDHAARALGLHTSQLMDRLPVTNLAVPYALGDLVFAVFQRREGTGQDALSAA